MPTTVTLKNLASFAGATNLQLFLRKSDDTLINAGGDTGVSIGLGMFAWTVSESIPSEDVFARIYEGANEDAATIVVDSILYSGQTEIGRQSAGGLTDHESDTLDSIAVALAGGSPVEPTGTNIRDQLQEIYDGLFPADPDTDPVVITPGTGDITTGWMVCLDETGEAEQDVSVYCQMSDVPSSETGFAHSSRIQTATSAANGVVEFSLVKGASYFFWRGKASPNGTLDPVAIPSEAGSTYELPSIRAIV